MVDKVKKRRITKKDWDFVQQHIVNEFEARKSSSFRKNAEKIWKEVDRQVRLEATLPLPRDGQSNDDWHNEVELGELSKASEILSADHARITFPNARFWFDPHAEIESEIDEEGDQSVPEEIQQRMDGALRALMTQQHKDFQLKSRVAISVKEALHHGSFGVEIRQESQFKVHDGKSVQTQSAPVWHPYSMWNTFPDPSASVITGSLFYTGSMIFTDYIPRQKFKSMAKGKGWLTSNVSKVPKRRPKVKDREVKDIELIKYYGDLSIERQDGDIFLPNSKVIIANGVIVFYAPNDLPYPSVIFSGYEKVDVRDPYHMSPLMKLSPMQKMGSLMANKALDAIDLKTEPPQIYNSNDPYLVESGGPVIAPGAKTPTKSIGDIKPIETGDPQWALQGLELAISQLQSGTAVDNIRAGTDRAETEKTAFEVRKQTQGGEIRSVDFVGKFEEEALGPFLYMQHELNKLNLNSYAFFNPEMDAPDFERASKKDLPKVVHFDIVGSKGILGEEERAEKTALVTQLLWGNPLTQDLPDRVFIAKQLYLDAGNKNPERFLSVKSKDDETQFQLEQMKQQFEEQGKEMQQQLQELQVKDQKHDIEKQQFKAEKSILSGQIKTLEEQLQLQDKVAEIDNRIVQEERVKANNIIILDDINDSLKELDHKKKHMESQDKDFGKRRTEAEKIIVRAQGSVKPLAPQPVNLSVDIPSGPKVVEFIYDKNGRITKGLIKESSKKETKTIEVDRTDSGQLK